MKKNLKRRLSLILCALLLSSSFISCSTESDGTLENDTADKQPSIQQQQGSMNTPQKNDQTEIPTQQENSNSSGTNQDIEKDRYEAQISYYMNLTESLQAELVKLKEEAYIDECEYKLRIESLEETISLLEATIDTLSANGNDQPSESPDLSVPNHPDYDAVVSKSDFKYTSDGGKITITGYEGKDLDVIIPSNIDGLPVTDIGEGAFKNTYVRSVVLPSSVRHIDWFAFSGCTCLESITIPSSVLAIDYGAFDYCPKNMTVKCDKGSYAEAYAKSWGMKTEVN